MLYIFESGRAKIIDLEIDGIPTIVQKNVTMCSLMQCYYSQFCNYLKKKGRKKALG